MKIALVALAFTIAAATVAPTVAYPDGFRRWTHVKSAIVEPASPAHARYGGIHHVYANAEALRGLETGRYVAGATFVFDRLDVTRTPTDISEGRRLSIDVMVRRDSSWSFERFDGDTRTPTLDAAAQATCAKCHAGAAGGVFSKLRP